MNRKIGTFFVLLGLSSSAKAQDFSFDHKHFMCPLSQALQANFPGPQYLENKFNEVARSEERLFNEWGGPNSFIRFITDIGGARYLFLHSLPLIDIKRWSKVYPVSAKATWPALVDFYTSLDHFRNPSVPSDFSVQLKNKITDYQTAKTIITQARAIQAGQCGERQNPLECQRFIHWEQSFPIVASDVRAALAISDPVIRWLLEQNYHSVQYPQLIEQALKIYNQDAFTALGVIGYLFDSEQGILGKTRGGSILASKMVPLTNAPQDKVGDNYHFWAYLNLGIKGQSIGPRVYSFIFEKLFQFDFEEATVDQLALTIGSQIRSNALKPTLCGDTSRK